MLRIGLVIDSAAEVPPSALADASTCLIPVKLQVDDKFFLDSKDPEFTASFNKSYLNIKVAAISQSLPVSTAEIAAFYLSQMATRFDHVFGLFVLSSRSPLFKNASDAASQVIAESMRPRNAAGIKGPLYVEAHDSMNISDGYAVQVLEVQRLMAAGATPAALRARITELSMESYCYVAPSQLDFIATRAKARGDQSAGALAIAAAKLLGVIPIILAHRGDTGPVHRVRGVEKARDHVINLARRELAQGLKAAFISASFSGDIAVIELMASWQKLRAEAAKAGVSVSLKEMSPTNSINLGPEALSLGLVAARHSVEL